MEIYLDNCCFNRPYDEQIIFNLKRQTFNYTEWQRDYFAQNFTLDTFLQKAKNVDEEPLRKNKDCQIM